MIECQKVSDLKRREIMLRALEYRMPKRICLLILGLITLAALVAPQDASAVRRQSRISAGIQVDIGDYDYLSDYGEWMELPQYGVVWHPYAVADWSPFFHGHWSWTYNGWAWISYEPFGWLVYHYGYWYHRPHIGWFWVPGRVWSPARVHWYTFGGYCAWAPIPPPGHYWPDPWDRHDTNVWIVININNFADEHVGHHRIDRPFDRDGRDGRYDRDVMRRGPVTRSAPPVSLVERAVNRRIPMVKIEKEREYIRPTQPRKPLRTTATPGGKAKRMITPERDLDKVRQNAPKVEREVLTPRKSAPRDEQRAPEQRSREVQKKKVKKR